MLLTIDTEKFEVIRNGKEIILPRKEFEILCLLCETPGKVFSRKNIFLNVWGEDSDSKERTVDVHILNLRRKFGSGIIRTIKGVGYRLSNAIVEMENPGHFEKVY
ncbi:MAG: winged helix-turn-helix transcriptional regulator [Bacteroidia bacterium]|nr:winged helix-turn-helix transcriptional regulator [Bacteroidia bacterium]